VEWRLSGPVTIHAYRNQRLGQMRADSPADAGDGIIDGLSHGFGRVRPETAAGIVAPVFGVLLRLSDMPAGHRWCWVAVPVANLDRQRSAVPVEVLICSAGDL
jgi:hypothetical protein